MVTSTIHQVVVLLTRSWIEKQHA